MQYLCSREHEQARLVLPGAQIGVMLAPGSTHNAPRPLRSADKRTQTETGGTGVRAREEDTCGSSPRRTSSLVMGDLAWFGRSYASSCHAASTAPG